MTKPVTASSGHDDDDLYGGLAPTKESSSRKRSLPDAKEDLEDAPSQQKPLDDTSRHQKTPKTEANSASSSAAQQTTHPLNVQQTLMRLEKHLVVDKKFPKAIALVQKLVASHFDQQSAPQVLTTLRRVTQTKPQVVDTPEFAQLVVEILSQLQQKQVKLSSRELCERDDDGVRSTDLHALVELWRLLCVDLMTDDTFLFAKAAKQVKKRLEAWLQQRQQEKETETDAQATSSLMQLLRRLVQRHPLAWAKVIVEDVVQLATRHRLLFDEAERTQVDAWTKQIQDRRFESAVTETLGVRGAHQRKNLVSQQQLTSATGIKVGQTFHPLFNRK